MSELPDRLLREVLRETAAAGPPDACADANALAAWADGTMSRDALAVFERHAADCARCQSLIAVMVRSEGVESLVEERESRASWWRSRGSWVVPLAAAAA